MTGRPCQCALAVFHKNVSNPTQNVESVIKKDAAALQRPLNREDDLEWPPRVLWPYSEEWIFLFVVPKRLRAFRNYFFTGGVTPSGADAPAPPRGSLWVLPQSFPPSLKPSPWGRWLDAKRQDGRVSLRTLPKMAGNISLTLREWGLFCIESRLHGAGGIGVMTINGKIYWACTLYAPAN